MFEENSSFDESRASSTGSSLDGSVDELNEQGIPKGLESRRETRFKNIVHLWEFLLELLANENCRSLITWSNKSRWEFKIRDPDEVAKRWGQYKRIKKMTYDKLSRALRYYYTKGIISKVQNQRLMYRFHKLPYKYEPGVTRSRYHGQRIRACLGQNGSGVTASQLDNHETSTSFGHLIVNMNPYIVDHQVRAVYSAPPMTDNDWPSEFTCVPDHVGLRRFSWSFPQTPTPSYSTLWNPGPELQTPPFYGRSKIMFPSVNNAGLQPVKLVGQDNSGVHKAGTIASSIPVSVIKRI